MDAVTIHPARGYYQAYGIIIAASVSGLAARRIALYFSDRCSGNHRRSTMPSSSSVQPAKEPLGFTFIFSVQAFQTKFFDRPAALRVTGFNFFGSLSCLQVLVVIAFFLSNIFLVLIPVIHRPTGTDKVWVLTQLTLRTGQATMVNLPLLFATGGRRNVLSCLTGIPYRSLNFLHRAVGRLCFLMTLLHAALAMAMIQRKRGTGFLLDQFSLKYFQAGIVALFALLTSVMMSLLVVRSRKFELFLLSHIGAAVTLLISVYYHKHRTMKWVLSASIIWGFDRLCRWLGIVYIHLLAPLWTERRLSRRFGSVTATLDHLDGAMVLRIPMCSMWEPGQHVYLSFWSRKMLSRPWLFGRWHPFTLTNLPNDAELQRKDRTDVGGDNQPWMACCVVQVRAGTTKWLEQHAGPSIQVFIQGPFGGHIYPHSAYSTLVLVAGGAGVTHVLSILEGVAMSARRGESGDLRRVEIYWMLRNQAHLAWVEHRVNEVCAALGTLSLDISAYAYITTIIPIATESPISPKGQCSPLFRQTRRDFEDHNHTPWNSAKSPVTLPPLKTMLPSAEKVSDHQYIRMIRNPLLAQREDSLHPGYSFANKMKTEFDHLPNGLKNKSVFTIRGGRPNFNEIFSGICDRSSGRILTHVCGPRSLSDAVKISAAKLASPLATWRGRKNRCIVVHQELFNTT